MLNREVGFALDFVAKVVLGWRTKFFRTADAFCTPQYEGHIALHKNDHGPS